jgi:hypothetical protein
MESVSPPWKRSAPRIRVSTHARGELLAGSRTRRKLATTSAA